ncbi:hypothetical protein P3T76_014089 [Phytophthora citrophthora]|uniref:Crinkler effector protein N-terminal domain-containing protein n=1 Tax=Phytophthora citrophthora TaxID=4793 RepID=A0AAD9G2L6_9STRA|nr:hypothetical protein P3T76_014089 [Phytophthora citrophthora]
MKLFCAIVGVAESAFEVDIAEDASVSALKKAIRAEPEFGYPNSKLQLFLAKKDKGKGAWLTEEDVAILRVDLVSQDYKQMKSTLKLDNDDIFGKSFHPGEDQVHVLVKFPEGIDIERNRVTVPMGPVVNVSSCDDLLAFLESEMTNKEETMSNPHILSAESLQFQLVGREDAIKAAANCFNRIIKAGRGIGSDRTDRPIPVCSGISGLGKTRMLEESSTIFQEMRLDPKSVVRLIVPYYNGYSPTPVERLMPIQASFSWRLLYRFFLDNNCALPFADWIESRLPSNGDKLRLSKAINVIERKLRQSAQGQESLYLYLGIDDYQKIERLSTSGANTGTSILRQLVEAIAGFLCKKSSGLVVLPMFAGTDLGIIASGSIANSSYYVTERLPMTLLTLGQVVTFVESNAKFAGYLQDNQVQNHLFALGGVPRWVVEYVLNLKMCSEPGTITLESIGKCFKNVWTKYVDAYMESMSTQQLVRLAAFAVSGRQVRQQDKFDKKFKWSKLRDSSLCLLNPSSTPKDCDVRVPYALLQSIASSDDMTSEAEKCFAAALSDMEKLVDSELFVREPWQSWEIFGACFYAVRINALLVIGRSTVTLEELLPGALIADNMCGISVKLSPSRVFQCNEQFGLSTPKVVSRKNHLSEETDWTSSGSIIVNGVDGEGVDIFFALKDALSGNLIVFVDQRKRRFGAFQPSSAKEHLRQLRKHRPRFLGKDTRLVGGVMNCVAPSNLQTYVVPHDCFLVTRDETKRFHGTLAYHPACSPLVPIYSANKTALMSVLIGSEAHKKKAAEEIIRKRKEPSGGFIDFGEVRSRFKHMKLEVEIDYNYAVLTR